MNISFKNLLTCSSLFAVTLVAMSASAAPILLNGSFEAPITSGGIVAGGGDNWTASNSTKGVYLITNGSGYGDTAYGTQYLALNPTYSDSQTISGFQSGVTYSFGTYFADLFNGPNPILTVTLTGAISLTKSFTAPVNGNYGSGTIPFTFATLNFMPTSSGSITLTLNNTSPDGALAVDNVMVNAIPEPSSFWLALFALGMAIGFGRKLRTSRD